MPKTTISDEDLERTILSVTTEMGPFMKVEFPVDVRLGSANMTVDQLQSGFYWIWKRTYSYRSILRRAMGSGASLFPVLVANMGLRFFTKAFVERETRSSVGEPA